MYGLILLPGIPKDVDLQSICSGAIQALCLLCFGTGTWEFTVLAPESIVATGYMATSAITVPIHVTQVSKGFHLELKGFASV